MKHYLTQGFTLVELLIACIAIIILGSIGISYFSYFRSDAIMATLKADCSYVATYEEIYRAHKGVYTNILADLEGLGFNKSRDNAITLTLSQNGYIGVISNPNTDIQCVLSTKEVAPNDIPYIPSNSTTRPLPGELKCG